MNPQDEALSVLRAIVASRKVEAVDLPVLNALIDRLSSGDTEMRERQIAAMEAKIGGMFSGNMPRAVATELADAALSILATPSGRTQEPVAWRVDDLTSEGTLSGSFALYSDYGAVKRHVRNGGIAHTKVTPLYSAPPAQDQGEGR